MKIIRPIDLTGAGIVESNAPPGVYAQWAPVGRDFLTGFDFELFDAVGGTLHLYRSSFGAVGVITSVDLATGDYASNSVSVDGNYIAQISASMDGQYIAVVSNSNAVKVYRLSDWQSVFELGGAQAIGAGYGSVGWTSDSSVFCFFSVAGGIDEDAYFWTVNTSTWSFEFQSGSLKDIATAITGTDKQKVIPPKGDGGLCADPSSLNMFFVYTSGVDDFSRHILIKINASTGAYSGDLIGTGGTLPGHRRVIYNSARSEILAYSPLSPRAFDAATLSENSLAPNIGNVSGGDISSAEIILQSTSVQPYWRRFAASDYTALTALDSALPSAAKRITYSDDYYVAILQSGGYALIDRTDDALITQTNPTVTAGDIYTYADHNWEALQDNNDRPDLGAQADPPTWLDLGFINPLRMFDNKLDSKTTGPSPLVIDITPGMLVNGIALFNVDAATVQITYTDPDDGLVYDTGQISMLDNSGVQDWYGFFFDPYLVKADLASVDLPAYIDGSVQITLDGAGADVSIGEVVLGTIYQIGDAQYGSSAGIIDFSRKEADQFGNFEIVPRRFSKRADFDAVIPPAYGGSVQRTLAQLRATPVVWIGSVDLEETIVYGYFREFDILLSNPAFSNVTITVEGL